MSFKICFFFSSLENVLYVGLLQLCANVLQPRSLFWEPVPKLWSCTCAPTPESAGTSLSLLPVVAARLSGSTAQARKTLTAYGKVSTGNIMTKSSQASLNTGRNAGAKAKTYFGLCGTLFLGAVLSGVLRAMICYVNHGDKCKCSSTGIHYCLPPWTALIHGQNT